MFGSKRIKYLMILFGLVIVIPVFSAEFDYSQTQKRISVQEEFGDYMNEVKNKISKTWCPPNVLEEGHATVIFKVDNNGNLLSSYIKESSGNSLYDESALNSIQNASPFEHFPEKSSKNSITVVYSFDSSIVDANQIKDLVQQSERYTSIDNQTALKFLDKAIASIEGDPSAYFLYARRYKINKMMGNLEAAQNDLTECKRLKIVYDKQRIEKCKKAIQEDETPFAYFTLANAYELAGDYQNAIDSINKAIGMTELNQVYKRYRAEIIMRNNKL